MGFLILEGNKDVNYVQSEHKFGVYDVFNSGFRSGN